MVAFNKPKHVAYSTYMWCYMLLYTGKYTRLIQYVTQNLRINGLWMNLYYPFMLILTVATLNL